MAPWISALLRSQSCYAVFQREKILETSVLNNWELPMTNPQTSCLLRGYPFPLRKTLTLSKWDNQYITDNTFKGCFSTYHKAVCVKIRKKLFLQDISAETNNKILLKLFLNARTEFSWPSCLNLSVVFCGFIKLSSSHLKFLWVSPKISLATVWKEIAEPLWLIFGLSRLKNCCSCLQFPLSLHCVKFPVHIHLKKELRRNS